MPPTTQYHVESLTGPRADLTVTLEREPHPPLTTFSGQVGVDTFRSRTGRPAGPDDVASMLASDFGLAGAKVTFGQLPVDADHPFGGMEVVVRVDYNGKKTARLAFYCHVNDRAMREVGQLRAALAMIAEHIRR